MGNNKDDQKIKEEHSTIKNFGYQLGGVALNFSLTDEQMPDFLALLEKAADDIRADMHAQEVSHM